MIIRIFPRRTTLTPNDEGVRIMQPPGLFDEAEQAHISVTFTADRRAGEEIYQLWRNFGGEVLIGGPAYDAQGGDFVPGKYLKRGAVITSRGCPGCCWYCDVPRREGGIRELPIVDGWNLLDNNLLACSRLHVEAVIEMLSRQSHRPEYTGGMEARRMEKWSAEAIVRSRPAKIYFAYDKPRDFAPLADAVNLLRSAGLPMKSEIVRAYVLCGYPGDNIYTAAERMRRCLSIGVMPYAMLYENREPSWRRFQRYWCRPAIYRREINQVPWKAPEKEEL